MRAPFRLAFADQLPRCVYRVICCASLDFMGSSPTALLPPTIRAARILPAFHAVPTAVVHRHLFALVGFASWFCMVPIGLPFRSRFADLCGFSAPSPRFIDLFSFSFLLSSLFFCVAFTVSPSHFHLDSTHLYTLPPLYTCSCCHTPRLHTNVHQRLRVAHAALFWLSCTRASLCYLPCLTPRAHVNSLVRLTVFARHQRAQRARHVLLRLFTYVACIPRWNASRFAATFLPSPHYVVVVMCCIPDSFVVCLVFSFPRRSLPT